MKINIERTVEKFRKISTTQKRELQIKLAELIAEDSQKEIAALEAKLAELKGTPSPQISDDL